MLITQWIFYILSAPILVWLVILGGYDNLALNLTILLMGYGVWVSVASVSLRKKRLILFTPAIIVADFLFRYIMIVSFVKALNKRTVESCKWNSPQRFVQENSIVKP